MKAYFWRAWLLCGTLDIVYAALVSMALGSSIGAMLSSVASGPFGDGVATWGAMAWLAGLLVHYGIMAVMVAAYGLAARRGLAARVNPWIAGTLYGLLLYAVMYLVVLPIRFPAVHPLTDPVRIARALFPHIFLVGVPMALIARRIFSIGATA